MLDGLCIAAATATKTLGENGYSQVGCGREVWKDLKPDFEALKKGWAFELPFGDPLGKSPCVVLFAWKKGYSVKGAGHCVSSALVDGPGRVWFGVDGKDVSREPFDGAIGYAERIDLPKKHATPSGQMSG